MPEQGASFIPKSGVKTVQRIRGGRRIYILAYISYIVFFSTLFVVVGTYLYAAAVNRSLSSLKEQLAAEQQRFSVVDVEQIRQFDNRMNEASRLLEEASAPSRIFSDIESIVSSDIYFSSMTYEQLPSRKFQIELIGRADNFNQAISQRTLLKDSAILKDAAITAYDYALSEEGAARGGAKLSFTFSDTRDLSVIAYQVSAEESMVVVSSPTSTSTAATVEERIDETTDEVSPEATRDETVVVGEPRSADNQDETTSDNNETQ
ncbi:MAG: hypothetical protein WD605_02860 [Candidatus Paceibacterota bacterium]